jgi:hypothetical protein
MQRLLPPFLNAPYPANTSYRRVLTNALTIGVFIAIFMSIFQPFGLQSLKQPNRLLLIACYGLPSIPVILILGSVYVWFIRKNDRETQWKVWHQIATTLTTLLVIGAANYAYSVGIFEIQFRWTGLFRMLYYTVFVGIFPVVGVILFDWALLLKKHDRLAHIFNKQTQTIEPPKFENAELPSCSQMTLHGENAGESVTLNIPHILFMKAEGNYVEIYHENASGKGMTHLIRSTLKAIEDQLIRNDNPIKRSHRSYLVNTKRVTRATGNAQGLTLFMDAQNHQVPVSRKYVEKFRNRE